MNLFNRLRHPLSIQVIASILCSVKCCNFGPGNLGLFNFGAGNLGFFNFGVGNGGIGNKGFLNGGLLNTGFSQLGIRNIGALNLLPVPNTISVFNVPVAPNLTPPLPVVGRRRRRRSTMKYPEGKFPWQSESKSNAKQTDQKQVASSRI